MNLDLSILTWMQNVFGVESWPYWNLITDLGSPPMLVLIIGLTLWIWGTAAGLRLLVAVMLNSVAVGLLKVLFVQPRPYYLYEEVKPWRDSTGFGMPSGHASGAMSLWGTVALRVRKYGLLCSIALLIFLIGLSRVYFGVHTPSHVLVGWMVGLGIIWTIWRFEKRAVRLFKRIGLWGQLTVAIASVLLLAGLQMTVIAERAASFETPSQWTQRYNEARLFEDLREGDTETEFRALILFDAFAADNLGALLGMWLLAIHGVHRGGYQRFSGRERIANVCVGLLFVGALIPLMDLVEHSLVWGILVWTATPVGLGIGVPAVGVQLTRLFNRKPNDRLEAQTVAESSV